MQKQWKAAGLISAALLGTLLAGCPAELAELTTAGYAFVDVDTDGVCDTCGQGVDGDGDGICDNFIDADGDGVCDNRQSHVRLGWEAHGYRFQDQDGDGICDVCGGGNSFGDGICDGFIDEDGTACATTGSLTCAVAGRSAATGSRTAMETASVTCATAGTGMGMGCATISSIRTAMAYVTCACRTSTWAAARWATSFRMGMGTASVIAAETATGMAMAFAIPMWTPMATVNAITACLTSGMGVGTTETTGTTAAVGVAVTAELSCAATYHA